MTYRSIHRERCLNKIASATHVCLKTAALSIMPVRDQSENDHYRYCLVMSDHVHCADCLDLYADEYQAQDELEGTLPLLEMVRELTAACSGAIPVFYGEQVIRWNSAQGVVERKRGEKWIPLCAIGEESEFLQSVTA